MKFLVGAHKSLLLMLIFMVFMVGKSLRPHHYTKSSYSKEGAASNGDEAHDFPKEAAREELGMELYPTGSSLPDCSHACGPCTPCKRVMVSFKCSVAESCPIVYRCMCKGKYYHVPSA
ncbi:hypothetical protein POTOM_044517 [Populus tomentosa]|uniref:Epidermal patterning factor-like protein n=1 Tax=Populus tomentosa TaxID=118781 RepID=A0A8X7YLX5_POPTO|nr:hypothetical protein POTOM_044517 [Populus tomentosa]